jgi:hypothetical protein
VRKNTRDKGLAILLFFLKSSVVLTLNRSRGNEVGGFSWGQAKGFQMRRPVKFTSLS